MTKKSDHNQGDLFIRDPGFSTWKPPEVLPALDSRFKRVGFDCETDGVDWRGKSRPIGYSVALEDGRKFYLPVGHLGGGNLDRGYVSNWLKRELRDKELVTCEGKFDIQMARKDGVDLEAQGNTIREIQYGAALLADVRTSFHLDDLGYEYCKRRKKDIDKTKIWESPSSLVGPYAEEDAALTLDVDTAQRPLLAEQGLEKVLGVENKLIWAVCEMERNGVPIDVEKLSKWRGQAVKKWNDGLLEIHRQTGLRVNPNSSLELEKLFLKLDLAYSRTAPTNTRPDGLPSFTNEFLSGVQHPLIQLIRTIKAVDSLRSKYLDKYWNAIKDGILYYSLHQLKANEYGTISGRFSSSKINIQQVFDPERQEDKLGFMEWLIRELFIPVPLHSKERAWWVKADASQIEFRLFVHYSKSARLIKRFCEDLEVDFHQMVADLCHITRKKAKNINFGKLFGMGREKMARQLGIPQHEADILFDQYNQMFPETQTLMNEVMSVAKRRGYVKTLLGRRARFPDADRLHSALNRAIQGSAADILKLKILEIYNNRKFLDYHKLLFTVHDDVNFSTYNLRKVKYIKELLEAPIEGIPIRVPIRWDVDIGDNWSVNYREQRAKSKMITAMKTSGIVYNQLRVA